MHILIGIKSTEWTSVTSEGTTNRLLKSRFSCGVS